MNFIGTKYEVTLKGADGAEFSKVRMIWDGVYKLGKLMWATYYPWNDTCVLYFADKYHDSELYDAGWDKRLLNFYMNKKWSKCFRRYKYLHSV